MSERPSTGIEHEPNEELDAVETELHAETGEMHEAHAATRKLREATEHLLSTAEEARRAAETETQTHIKHITNVLKESDDGRTLSADELQKMSLEILEVQSKARESRNEKLEEEVARLRTLLEERHRSAIWLS
jgi:soluble cytochrome b562